jgi:xanthine dehydrogenase accessory factor
MREYRQIVDRWHEGSASILMTLVRVQGSSYRRPGARLLVSRDGTYEGSISAGCLEADLLRKATWLVREGSAVERYSTLFDEGVEIPFGLGCGGVLDVLLEPVDSVECHALLRAIEATLTGCEHLVATWLPVEGRAMERAVFRNGELIFSSRGLSLDSLSKARLKWFDSADSDQSGMFFERLTPPQRLFVFGAGDDAKPLVTMASLLGWNVTVVDGRGHLARKTRFPEANVRVMTNSRAALEQINSRDAVVLMTHSYEQDKECLSFLLPLRPRYLGLLGSRKRSAVLIHDAAAKLDYSLSECCARISAPIGLDLGGEGPEAIALAIIAEALASCTGKRNTPHKLSAEHVEGSFADGDVLRFEHAQCDMGTV